MLVIQSDDVDPSMLADLKQQFNAAINSVANAWRMPVIKVGVQDKVEWRPIENSSRDMEFQYLADSNARVILSAFNMSPEELPGYAHLSRGTNNQALSESNNEYKLEAGRDVGIRPLLSQIEEFLSTRILPLLDEEVAKYCSVRLHGLDAETPEKEATRIEKEQALHGTYNDTLRSVDKETLPKEWAGDFPLNPAFEAQLDKYFTVGQIKEYFFGIAGAAKDPKWDYARDPFYFQNLMVVQQQQQMEQQNQMAQQQMQQQQQVGQQDQQAAQKGHEDSGEIVSGIDQLMQNFAKSEKQLSSSKRKLQAHHEAIVKNIMEEWEKESEKMVAELSSVVKNGKR